MGDFQYINFPVSGMLDVNNEPEDETAEAARELLQNGILVETNKGLVCMSLNDALNHGVGGHSLSEEDFQNVAAKLLYQETPKPIILADNASVISENETLITTKPKKVYKQLKRTVLRSKLNSNKTAVMSTLEQVENDGEVSLDLEPIVLSTTTEGESCTIFQDNFKSLTALTQKPLVDRLPAGRKKVDVKSVISPIIGTIKQDLEPTAARVNSKMNHFASILIDSNFLGDFNIECSASGEDIETSDNSEITQTSTSTSDEKPKKRGGWPKGRKRKPELKSESRPPKAPATGYVLFLNERRKDYKDMSFTEVTKLLGNEWSKLNLAEKKAYLDQAEVEKKRYREELKSYRQSDAYQIYLKNKRLKRLQGNGTEESDMDATDEIDDEDNEELYCRSCDQWFHSLHNKKEHLYGRQHLQSVAGRLGKAADMDWGNANMSSTSLDESSLDGTSCLHGNVALVKKSEAEDSLMMDDAIVRLMAANRDREEERVLLRRKFEELRNKNVALSQEMEQLTWNCTKQRQINENVKRARASTEQLLINLLSVPSLFCPPDPTAVGAINT